MLYTVLVKALSDTPDIPDNVLGGLGGAVALRVCARNRAGRGTCSEPVVVFLNGEMSPSMNIY